VEKALSHIDPSLEFWHHTNILGYLQDQRPVSLNIIDVALNYCNQLPYSNRVVHYFRSSLWHELMIRYMKHENVEQAIMGNLESQLVEEPAVV
jgi:flagellar motor switch protein FliG